MNELRLSGVIVPMITPMTAAGEVDADALGRLTRFLVGEGVSGLFVLGSSGEGAYLDPRGGEKVIATVVDAARGRVPVLAGALQPSTPRAIEVARMAGRLGASAVVVTTPYYGIFDQASVMRHVRAIADAVELPVLLYNIPSATGNAFEATTVKTLSRDPRIVGLKDSSADATALQRILLDRQDAAFCVLQGAERLSACALMMGCDGLVPGLANIAPALFVELARTARQGDWRTAQAIQAAIEDLWRLYTPGHWLACLKAAAALRGFGSGAVTPPISPATPEDIRMIREVMARHGLVGEK